MGKVSWTWLNVVVTVEMEVDNQVEEQVELELMVDYALELVFCFV